jgi:hypothetical protein
MQNPSALQGIQGQNLEPSEFTWGRTVTFPGEVNENLGFFLTEMAQAAPREAVS